MSPHTAHATCTNRFSKSWAVLALIYCSAYGQHLCICSSVHISFHYCLFLYVGANAGLQLRMWDVTYVWLLIIICDKEPLHCLYYTLSVGSQTCSRASNFSCVFETAHETFEQSLNIASIEPRMLKHCRLVWRLMHSYTV